MLMLLGRDVSMSTYKYRYVGWIGVRNIREVWTRTLPGNGAPPSIRTSLTARAIASTRHPTMGDSSAPGHMEAEDMKGALRGRITPLSGQLLRLHTTSYHWT